MTGPSSFWHDPNLCSLSITTNGNSARGDVVELDHVLDIVCSQKPEWLRDTLKATFDLIADIVREGHEGRPVGTLITIGRADDVLASSRPLILDPLAGHEPHATRITDSRLRGTLKQLAQLDGAFVMAEDGTVVSACRYLDVPAHDLQLPLGLGSRHIAAAAISKELGIVAIVASASGTIRTFCGGELVGTLEAASDRNQKAD
jgi:DNA integrity scanning protein DisA with diadenylate cyclase activity